jgi:hypothetical protein
VSDKAICSFIKPDGTTCKATCLPSSTFCYFHDPAKEQERTEARRRGGRTRSQRPALLSVTSTEDVSLESVADVLKLLAQTATDVRKDAIDPKRANRLAYIASVGLRAIEGADFEARLQRLEALAQEKKRA